jgi:alpha-beta hydrolase superfamily lysophospholipase
MTLNNESKRNIVSWLPLTSTVKEGSSVKAIILIAHGLNEHSLRHSEMAHNYAKLGILSEILVVIVADE